MSIQATIAPSSHRTTPCLQDPIVVRFFQITSTVGQRKLSKLISGNNMASKFTKDHLSEFVLVFFRYFFRRAYGLSCAIFTHHLLLRSTGFSGPRERVPKNAFPLKRNAYFLAFPLRSLCVP